MAHETPPEWDRAMRRRLERGEAAALAELYDRFASLAYGIAQRVLSDEDATARVTREVFGRIWATPDSFDPEQGPMRSWIADEAHRLAVARLRRREGAGAGSAERIRTASTLARADYIVTAMPAPLREALELARGGRTDYREVARELGISDAEARRRLRLGLQLLSSAATYPDGGADDVRREHRG
ncbi:RNA polymerase [Streptomyces sp. JH002]|uniref:RNA polymerase sigma factor n=1 Tax=Streptomyces TaxID=1883 RepID=UPI003691C1A0